MADAVGPVFTGGFEEFVVTGDAGEQYTILYLPDRNNDLLQREGKAPVYYWVPGTVRLARFGDTGDFKFRHIHFVGVLNENVHVGVEGQAEVVGGLLSFTTTSRYPTSVLQQAEQQLLRKFRGDDDRYWGWRTQAAPMFRIAPIRSNITAITNLAPGSDGTAPAENIGGGSPATGGTPPSSMIRRADLNRQVVHGRANNISNLDAWAWELRGQGPGSVTGGENAYAGLIGKLPSELVWAGFHGGASPIVVAQNLQLPVWSQEIWLKISGEWSEIFQHFSTHAQGRYKWFSADIKAEFNSLRTIGKIKVEMAIDGTIPRDEDKNEEINKRIDLILNKFMEQASQRIFEPARPNAESAQAPSRGLFAELFDYGGGLALKYRHDENHLDLRYEETGYHRYLQPNTISSSFEGFYNTIRNNPEEEKKYFIRHILGDYSGKVTRLVKPVVNWPDQSKDWVGEPVAFLSAEIGYPGPVGTKQWTARVFQSTDTGDETNWNPAFARREKDEVANPPGDWDPDVTYVRRRVHLSEPRGITDNPFVNVDVEQNVIELDPEGGRPTTDSLIEVRADSVGKLEVGPVDIDVVLQDNTQVVTVEFQADGNRLDGGERPVVKFQWNHDDQDQPRYWEIFTGDLNYVPHYKYRVTVNVKGTIFSAGMAWTGPWIEGQGNGPMMVHVPRPDEEGVHTRRMIPREIALPSIPEGQAVVEGEVAPPPGDVPSEGTGTPAPPPSDPLTNRTPAEEGKEVAGWDLSERLMEAPPSEHENEAHAERNEQPAAGTTETELEEYSGEEAWVKI